MLERPSRAPFTGTKPCPLHQGHWNDTITSGGANATSAAKERQRRHHGWTSWGTSVPDQRRRCREVATGLRLRHQCRTSTPTTAAPPALLRRHRLKSPQRTPIREYPWGRIRLLRGGGVSPPLRATTRAGRGRFAPADQPPWPACLGGERRRRPSAAAHPTAAAGPRPTNHGAARSKQEEGGDDGARTRHSTPATAPSGGGAHRHGGGESAKGRRRRTL